MTAQSAAITYALLVSLPVAMHFMICAGAPLGKFTVGGRFPGQLPPAWRGLAVVQAAILIGMALVVLANANVIALALPNWLIWPVLAMNVLTLIANFISPSRPERLLWVPVLTLMLATLLLSLAL